MTLNKLGKISAAKNASLILATSGIIASFSSLAPANAASLSYTLNEFTGTDAQVNITLDDAIAGANKVRVTAAVNSTNTGNLGDIVGLFFNLANNTFINALSVAPVTQTGGAPLTVSSSTGANKLFIDNSGSTTDGTKDVSNNVNLNGGGVQRTFDVAVQVGTGGAGQNDFYRSVTFDLVSSIAGFDLNQFIGQNLGVRLQSVGPDREGSSKLEGLVPQPPQPPASVPEPSAIVGLMLVGGAVKALRRKQAN